MSAKRSIVDTKSQQILAAIYQKSRQLGRSLTYQECCQLLSHCQGGSRAPRP